MPEYRINLMGSEDDTSITLNLNEAQAALVDKIAELLDASADSALCPTLSIEKAPLPSWILERIKTDER
jgi:hypothetical protein